MCGANWDVRFGPIADIAALAESPNSWPEISSEVDIGTLSALTKFFCPELFWLALLEMRKKNLLHYELYGTSARGDKKGYWRWAIFAGREEKPLEAGSFYGTLGEAKEHAEGTIASLKQRARKHTTPRSK